MVTTSALKAEQTASELPAINEDPFLPKNFSRRSVLCPKNAR
jgi:hypothetical protein